MTAGENVNQILCRRYFGKWDEIGFKNVQRQNVLWILPIYIDWVVVSVSQLVVKCLVTSVDNRKQLIINGGQVYKRFQLFFKQQCVNTSEYRLEWNIV